MKDFWRPTAAVQISNQTFDGWVRQHPPLLYGIPYWCTGARSDAEELTQEACFQAYRSRSGLRDIEAVKGWLVRILRHCYAQMCRKGHSGMEIPLDDVMERSGETIDLRSDGADPDDSLALHQALERLDERLRLPLVLFYFQGLSYREIAEVLELPLGTVMSQLFRARQLLHESLTRPVALTLGRRSET